MNDSAPPDGSGDRPLDAGPEPRRRKRLRRKLTEEERDQRRLRIRRHGRRAYIRSVYSLPSLATLGNAICGFASIYVAAMDPNTQPLDKTAQYFLQYRFLAAAYFIFIAMLFDALDGRLARFARHTTDFGGQLDSLADVVSFGFAPMFLALQLFGDFTRSTYGELPPVVTKTVWSIGALYMCCAMIRLARFNVSNEHGEQHHFSFLGLPSPGAAAVVASFILMQQDLAEPVDHWRPVGSASPGHIAAILVWLLPVITLCAGLLMVSTIRYPHLVNRYLRGRRSIQRLVATLVLLLLLIVIHRYTLAIGTLIYTFWGPLAWAIARARKRTPPARSS